MKWFNSLIVLLAAGTLLLEPHFEAPEERPANPDETYVTYSAAPWAEFDRHTMVCNDALASNAASNQFGQIAEICLRKTGETVFRSDVIAPGGELSSAQLNQAFAPGVYDAILYINCVDSDGAYTGARMGYEFDIIVPYRSSTETAIV